MQHASGRVRAYTTREYLHKYAFYALVSVPIVERDFSREAVVTRCTYCRELSFAFETNELFA